MGRLLFSPSFTPRRLVIIGAVFLCSLVLGQGAAAQSSAPVARANASPPIPPAPPATDQEQFLSYWTTEAGWMSEIQLRNNRAGADLTVTPVLRSADGAETPLSPVTVRPQEVRIVDVSAAIKGVAPQLMGTYGSVVLRYHSSSTRNLFAMAMIHGIGHPFSFHIDPSEQVPNYETGSREGVWWLPQDTTTDYLILANRGRDPIDLVVSVYDASGKEFQQKVALAPAATRRYSVRQLAAAGGLGGTFGGVRVFAAAHAGSLDTVHVLFDDKAGFAALLKMFDHDPQAQLQERDYAKTGVWTLRAPMLALSSPDPALEFPPGTALHPQLFIHNTTAKPLTAALRFNWRSDNATGRASGPALTLNPYETRRLDVGALQDGKVLPKDAHWASVILTTNGNPDEILAVAASYDETLKHGAQTPFSDQLSFQWMGSLWEYDTQHDSLITAGNGGTKPARAAFTIFYNQGMQKYELEQTLQPDEQMWIDVGKLIREHVPDKNGNVLLPELTSGTYEFRDLTNKGVGALFEGKVVYDKTYGHAAYGCGGCCGYGSAVVFYDPLVMAVGSTATNGVFGWNVCNDVYDDVSDSFFGTWSVANTAIATVDYFGTHTGVAPGSTTSQASAYLPSSLYHCPPRVKIPSGDDDVTPSIASISPTQGPVGNTVSVTINGNGFGTSPTVSAGSGITATINSASNTQIQASFNISSSATPGNHSVTVTASGQTSNSVNFFVQVPTSLQMVAGSSNTQQVSSCVYTVNGQQYNGAGCKRTLKWQVMDQRSPAQAIQFANLSASDSLDNAGGTNTCLFPAHGGTTGTGFTDGNGQFPDTYTTCSSACLNGGSCQSTELQTWTVGGVVLSGDVKTVVYTCTSITINGQ